MSSHAQWNPGTQSGRFQVSFACDLSGLPKGAVTASPPLGVTSHCSAAQTDETACECSSCQHPVPSAEPESNVEPTSTALPASHEFVVIGTPVAQPGAHVETVRAPAVTVSASPSSHGSSGLRPTPDPVEKVPQSDTTNADTEHVVMALTGRIAELESQVQRQLEDLQSLEKRWQEALTRDVWVAAGDTGKRYHTAQRCGGFAGNETKLLSLCKTCRDRMGV